MRTIAEILAGKRLRDVVTVSATSSVLEGDRVVGIFTERDLMRRVVLKDRHIDSTPVSQVMTRELIFTEPGEPGEEAMSKMTRHRCRHLPVVDGERLVGLISIGDVMKEISDEQSVEIRFLKEYIYSR